MTRQSKTGRTGPRRCTWVVEHSIQVQGAEGGVLEVRIGTAVSAGTLSLLPCRTRYPAPYVKLGTALSGQPYPAANPSQRARNGNP